MSDAPSDRGKRIQSFLGFFPQALSKESRAPSPEDQPATITEREKIILLLVHATENEHPVKVQLTGESNPFFSLLVARNGQSLDHLTQAECLLIAPLDPPIGNIKIRRAATVHLNFFTSLYIVDAKVQFLRVTENGAIQLSFPTTLERGPQKRSHPRIKVVPQSEVELMVLRPAGITFKARIFDISEGGICFFTQSATARIEEESQVQLEIRWPEGADLRIPCLILGVTKKESQATVRGKFVGVKAELAREIKRLIQHLEDEQRNRRRRTFG